MKTTLSFMLFIASILLFMQGCDTPTPASALKDITSFSFESLDPAVTGTISGTDITLTVPYDTDPTNLAPTIEVSLGASVSPASGVAQDFSGGSVTYTVTAADGSTQEYTVSVDLAPPLIASFIFEIFDPDVVGVISGNNITLTVPYDTALTNLTPAITIPAGATVSPESGAAGDFSSPVVYTINAAGTGDRVYTVSVTNDPYNLSLRDTGPAGGLIFHINPNAGADGWKYMEASLADLPAVQWEEPNYAIWDAVDTTIGGGLPNTLLVLPPDRGTAAKDCHDHIEGGYDDWFLPSPGELVAMHNELQSSGLGNFQSASYWSSAEIDDSFSEAIHVNLGNGNAGNFGKEEGEFPLRPARRF